MPESTMTHDPELLARLRELLAKATKRPWRVFDSVYGNQTIAIMKGDEPPLNANGYHVRRWPEIVTWSGFDGTDVPKRFNRPNADLIVAAVNALPALLAEIETLRAQVAALPDAPVVHEDRQAAIEAALAAWRALPEDERNGERPFIMGFNAGWDEAVAALPPAVEDGVQADREAAFRISRAFLGNDDALPMELRNGTVERHFLLDEVANHRRSSVAAALAYRGDEGEHMSPAIAEVCGIVSAMHTKWMQRGELMRQQGGFDLIAQMADLMDGIVDAVPELQRKLWAALASQPSNMGEE